MKRNHKALLYLLPVVLLWTQAFSCNNYHNMIVMEHDFKSAVGALQTAETSEFQAGNIDAATHKQIEQLVSKMALGGQQVALLLQQNATKQTIATEVGSINASVQALLSQGVLGIKNPTTQTNIRVMTQAISDIIQNFATALGVAVPVTTTVGGAQ